MTSTESTEEELRILIVGLYFSKMTKSISHNVISLFLLQKRERKLTHTDREIGKRAIITRDQSHPAAGAGGGVAQILSYNHLNNLGCNFTKSLSNAVQCNALQRSIQQPAPATLDELGCNARHNCGELVVE